jgi:hypothetical protein
MIGRDRQAAMAVARSPRSTERSEERGTVMSELSAERTRLAQLWEEHMRHEFQTCSTEDTLATMVEDAYVNHVPVMTGAVGHAELRQFYATHFIPKMPPDMEMMPLSRTIGTDQLVDEMVVRFTHTVEMDWALPSQKFGANAAWLRLNVILYNLLSAYKRVGLPEELHTARPKRLRFLLLNTVGKVVRHARETLLRCPLACLPLHRLP